MCLVLGFVFGALLKRIIAICLFFVIIYFGVATFGLKFYLSELVFKKIPDVESTESVQFSIASNNDELLIRLYGEVSNPECVIFFPGLHGGVLKYETEIFKTLTARGFSVYALSYPGVEGANGTSTFDSVKIITLDAVKYIIKSTSCEMNNTIYVGRSLGASVALMTATNMKPKGIVLDSVAASLSKSIRIKLSSSIFTKPINILPIEMFIGFDILLENALKQLKDVPITIFQGENDSITPLENIELILEHFENVKLYPIAMASHHNTYIVAGSKYIEKIAQLMEN